jgi:hypothetical protein
MWPVAEATAARTGGRSLGNNRRRGDTAPADRCARMPALTSLASGLRASSSMAVAKVGGGFDPTATCDQKR